MLIDPSDLVRRGRPWAESAVWGALWILSSGDSPVWLAPHQPSRIRRRLRSLSTSGFLWAARTRAEVHRFRATERVRQALRPHLLIGGADSLGVASGSLDGYVTPERFAWIRTDFPIVPDDDARDLTLRVSGFGSFVDSGHMPVAFAAADMATSTDTAAATQGLLILDDLLRNFKGERRDWLTVPDVAAALAGETDEVFALRLLARALSDARSLSEPADVVRFLQKPTTTGDRRWDVLLAAAVARECRNRKIDAPAWTDVQGLEPWWFPALVDETLVSLTIQRTPPELASRGVWLDERALGAL